MVSGEMWAYKTWKNGSVGGYLIPDTIVGWNWWLFTGKGPKWICWGCKKYSRGPLFSNKEPSLDATYGIVGYNPQRWEKFDYLWYCKDCIFRMGYVW